MKSKVNNDSTRLLLSTIILMLMGIIVLLKEKE